MAGLNDAEDKREDLSRPGLVMSGLHLAALWSLAVLQPLLNLLGSTPEFFVARDNTPGQITAFVLLATILPPLVAILIEAVLKLVSDTARWAFHLALVGLLFCAPAMGQAAGESSPSVVERFARSVEELDAAFAKLAK